MSRLAKRPLAVPAGVTVTVGAGELRAKGPKGELAVALPAGVSVAQTSDSLQISVSPAVAAKQPAVWGLVWALTRNVLQGVSVGFTQVLEINGVGYRAALEKNQLVLRVGYSHPVTFTPPAGVAVSVDKNTITIAGPDKQQVGQVAADIRAIRPPEPYKGKGIKYAEEKIRRKAGKVTKSAA